MILLFPSRLSKCPRSPLSVILAGAVCVSWSRWRNSWWKCRRSFPALRCTVLWSRTWTSRFLMVVGRVGGGRLLGLHTGQSSTAFGGAEHFPTATAEQLVDIPVPRGGRVLHPASSSSGLLGTANQGFFALFLREKKVRRWVRTRSRNWVRTLLHPSRRLSWRISSRMQLVCGCGFQVVGGKGWDGALVMRQPTITFGRISQ